jgi:hypothetical protein
MDATGRVCGFTFSCDAQSPISALPLSRYTFYGHTACECEVSSAEIIQLLSNVDNGKETMRRFLLGVRERSKESVATFACRPDNVEGYTTNAGMVHIRNKKMVDSQKWVPEVPDLIGIYHSFVRGHNRDTRTHKLFIIVSGGCCKASDEFYNVVLDCHGQASAKDCVLSEVSDWSVACMRVCVCVLLLTLWMYRKHGG